MRFVKCVFIENIDCEPSMSEAIMGTRFVSALNDPEPILDSFKSYSTRALIEAALLGKNVRPWARHGSTIYLWKERDVERLLSMCC